MQGEFIQNFNLFIERVNTHENIYVCVCANINIYVLKLSVFRPMLQKEARRES